MDDLNLEKDAPKLFGLEKRNIYRAPEGLFEELESNIHEQITSKTTVRLIRMERWFEFSAAAVIAGVVLLSGLKLLPNQLNMTDSESSTIYSVPDGTGTDYYPIF